MIVVWRVIDSCNLGCSFCAYDRRMGFQRRAARPEDILRFASVLADHQAQTGDRVLLSWLGGEPLLWKPLEGITNAVRATGLMISATTNGTALGSSRLRKHLCEAYQELTISIDGFSDFHDHIRDWKGGFDKLRAWVPQLAEQAIKSGSPLKLRANVVLMRQNVGSFGALCVELAQWGISEITFNQLGGRDRPEFYPAHRLTVGDVDLLALELPATRRRLADLGVELVGGESYLSRIRASAMDWRNPVEDCSPGESFLFIDEKGIISPCSFTTSDYGIDMRTLRTGKDVAELPCRFRTLREAKRSTQCDDCLSTQVCDKFQRPLIGEQTSLPKSKSIRVFSKPAQA